MKKILFFNGGYLKKKNNVSISPCSPPGQHASSSPSPRPKKPPMIWDHFEALPSTAQQGKCKACRMNVSCKYNTGNFVRHLQLAHKDIYRQYQNKIESQWTR